MSLWYTETHYNTENNLSLTLHPHIVWSYSVKRIVKLFKSMSPSFNMCYHSEAVRIDSFRWKPFGFHTQTHRHTHQRPPNTTPRLAMGIVDMNTKSTWKRVQRCLSFYFHIANAGLTRGTKADIRVEGYWRMQPLWSRSSEPACDRVVRCENLWTNIPNEIS